MSNALETITGTVQFHSAEWYLDADLQNSSFKNGVKSKKRKCFCCCQCQYDDELLKSGQWLMKVLEICLCLFILLVCPFTSGFYGESGISIFVAAVSIAITMAFVVVKLQTVNRWLTPKHWFILESLTYGLLAVGLILCALATILLNVHRRVLQTEVLQTNSVPSTDPLLIFFVAMALFLASAAYVVDIWVVYRQRRWRTWIVDRSKYQI